MIKLTPFYSRNINAYNPFYEMERLEKAFFGDSTQPVMFKTDISDSGDAYIVESDLPGINKEDIDINIGDGVLTVKAERKYESSDENAGNISAEKERTARLREASIFRISMRKISTQNSKTECLFSPCPKNSPRHPNREDLKSDKI
ncbi:MAG: Hsp20 family protein [Clostridia bacterium]|nr:Hsp20 family protein [Clostridia bacterium]